jgi:5-methylcytosine-specific restriction endonuclease McrA
VAYKYTDQNLAEAVRLCTSYRAVLQFLGMRQAGGSQTHITRRVQTLGLDTSHFKGQGWNKGCPSPQRKTATEILVRRSINSPRQKRKQLHRALQEIGRAYCCVRCGNKGEWENEPLCLEIDHIDGDWYNDQAENLRYLCPNCHSQTPNHGNKKRASVPELVAGDTLRTY